MTPPSAIKIIGIIVLLVGLVMDWSLPTRDWFLVLVLEVRSVYVPVALILLVALSFGMQSFGGSWALVACRLNIFMVW